MTVINKKSITVVIVLTILILIGWGVYKISTFSLFDDTNTELTEIVIPDKPYKLKLYHVPSNATTQSYIQVRKVEGDNEYVINNYERYNYVVSHVIKNGALELVLKTTPENKTTDTVYVKLD